eukprot:CCRYP_000378-RA/>CCRYP_000378-RA protein AED:0.02 eAED:0.02 QI:929/1/0.66/1/0.5/0.33/3/111/1239
MIDEGPASLTDSERFSSDGSNTSKGGLNNSKDHGTKKLRTPLLPSSSRRRVGIATDGAITRGGTMTSTRKSSSFHVEESSRRASSCSSSHVVKNGKSLDASSGRGERQQQQQRRPPRKYIQESPPPESSKPPPRQQDDTASSSSGTPPPKRPPRRYVQQCNASSTSSSSSASSRQPKERRHSSSILRTSKVDEEPPKQQQQHPSKGDDEANIQALLRENEALEAERATMEKYKRMYEAILEDPENAFLFETTSTTCASVLGGVHKNTHEGEETKSREEGEDTFTTAINVEELIRGLKLKDLLHESSAQLGSSTGSESVSVLSEIRQGEAAVRTARASVSALEHIDEERRVVGVKSGGRSGGGKRGGVESTGGKSRGEDGTRRKSRCASGRGGGVDGSRQSCRDEEVSEEQRVKSRAGSKRGGLESSIKSHSSEDAGSSEQRVKSRAGSKKGGLESSIKSHSSEDAGNSEQRVKSRSNSKRGGLDSSIKSHPSDDVGTEQRVKSRSNSKRGGLDSSIKSHPSDYPARSGEEPRRKPSQRRSIQDPNLNASTTSEKSTRSSSSRYDPSKDDRDAVSISSNASRSSSRMRGLLNRFSFSSNADDDMATDGDEDVVPDLSGHSTLEKKEKRGLFRTMKKFGQKVSKVFVPSGPGGIKRYKVGEVARYNIGKIRDSFESFDPCDPTVEVTIIAVHIDAVLEIPYYTIQLPDGSRKQTNMENLIPLEDYNNGTRPYSRIKEKRSSSRRRSSRRDPDEEDDDDDRSVHSNKSSRSVQSNRSSSSRRSSRQPEESDNSPTGNSLDNRDRQSSRSSSRHRNEDRGRYESTSRNRSSSHHQEDRERGSGSRRSKSYRDEDDDNYRPKVDAMRGGGMAAPDNSANLRRSETLSKTGKDDKGSDDEEPVIIKLSSRNSVGGSFALDAAVAAAVGARRSAAVSVSSSRSCCTDSYKWSAPESPVKKESQDTTKPPVVVELSQKKSQSATKSSVVVDFPHGMIKHAKSVDDATVRLSRCGSEQRRSRSTGPPREKPLPHGSCSKCDGCHLAVDCPIYLKDREKHKDAWRYYADKNKKKQMGEDGGNKRVKAKRIKQPADGNCLFHSLVYCLNSMKDGRMISSSMSVSSSSSTTSSCVPPPLTAKYLRRKIASFVGANPNLLIAEDPLKEWILWDSGKSVQDYAAAMAVGGWGGGVEIAACSHMYNVNIHVYETDPKSDEFVRISCFNLDSPKRRKTLHVLYHGRNHYDALQLK